MVHVLDVIDRTGRRIYLPEPRWKHIAAKHPDVATKLYEIENALRFPTTILPQELDKTKHDYYLRRKASGDYLVVVVKYLNGTGYVLTAFRTRKLYRT